MYYLYGAEHGSQACRDVPPQSTLNMMRPRPGPFDFGSQTKFVDPDIETLWEGSKDRSPL